MHYNQTNSKHFAFPASTVPEQLQGQMSVLRYFASYMEQHLMKVGAGTTFGMWFGRGTPWSQAVAGWSPWGCVLLAGQCPWVWDQGLTRPFLPKGGDLPSIDDLGQPALLLLQWVKTDQALLMLFSSGTLQVCGGCCGGATLGKPPWDS